MSDPLGTLSLQSIALLPQALYDDVAIGAEALPDIFAKYGYSADLAERYRDDPRFKKLVFDRQRELEEAGLLHAHRAAAVADMTLQQLAARVIDPATPSSVLMDVYKATAKMGNLEPKTGANVEVKGNGFSIKFNLGQPAQGVSDVIDADVVQDTLPPPPEHLRKINAELEYDDE